MVSFDLHRLGWHGFQRLCLTIVREVFGQTVQAFLDSRDGGRDGAFAGCWTPQSGEKLTGQFIVQCKFTSKPSYSIKLSDLTEETAKAARLRARGRCDNYILLTNAGLSGRVEEDFSAQLRSVGVETVLAYGSDWICQQIEESKRLRMLVPRVYGLGDLSEILDERAYEQGRALLEAIRDDLARVVMTATYQKAAQSLDRHGFVLLIGEPASGKTTIASMLSMAALDQWSASTLKLDHPSQVVDHWNPNDRFQFFWIDDAFGVTQYEPQLTQSWNHVFAQVSAMLRRGAKMVMTSRDYIYNRARSDLKFSGFPILLESQVVIDVRDLSLDEKRQILYNHIKLGPQPKAFRSAIKPYLSIVAKHPRFVPETARRLSEPILTRNLRVSKEGVLEFVEKQRQLLLEVLAGLDIESKAGLALIFMRNGALESPIQLGASEAYAIERFGGSLGPCANALNAMNGSLVRYSVEAGECVWSFKHPTIGDAFAELLLQHPELLGIYVRGAPIRQLVRQITCGDLGLDNAVTVPQLLYPVILERLEQALSMQKDRHGWDGRNVVDVFLAHRCSKDFLTLYLSAHPETLYRVANPSVFLSALTEVAMAVRLFDLGLLPDDNRRTFVENVSRYAIEDGDPEPFTNEGIRRMFREDEWWELRTSARDDLVPSLGAIRWGLIEGCRSTEDDPEGCMQVFFELCDALEAEFAADEEAVELVEKEREHALAWIGEEYDERPREPDEDQEWGALGSMRQSSSARSIFDDVDE